MKFEELWVIRGSQPVLWTVPMWLLWDPKQHEATLYCSLNLPSFMLQPLESILRANARPYNGMWLILREDLQRIAYQITPPVNPVTYVSWQRHEHNKEKWANEEMLERDEFIDTLFQLGVGRSRAEVAYWWRQFCNHSMHWILMKERPVDMGFLILHPSMYRLNWRQVLLSKYPKLGLATATLNDVELKYILHKNGFMGAMLDGDMLAMKVYGQYCYRHVEVEYTKAWHKGSHAIERERRRRLGPFVYSLHKMDAVRRSLPAMLRIYRQWLAHIARPVARFIASGAKQRTRMVPARRGRGRPRFNDKVVDGPVVPNKLAPFTENDLESHVFAPPADVPAVPDLQPTPPHLREHQPKFQGPDDWSI